MSPGLLKKRGLAADLFFRKKGAGGSVKNDVKRAVGSFERHGGGKTRGSKERCPIHGLTPNLDKKHLRGRLYEVRGRLMFAAGDFSLTGQSIS